MCVVSFVGDYYRDRWAERPYIQPYTPPYGVTYTQTEISREEFEQLKLEVLEMKELLKRALKYDKENGEPHCEMDEKVELLKKVAEFVGVDLSEIFSK